MKTYYSLREQWEFIKPIWRILLVTLLAQLAGGFASIIIAKYDHIFLDFLFGGVVSTFPGFILGLLWQVTSGKEAMKNSLLATVFAGVLCFAITLGAFFMPLEKFAPETDFQWSNNDSGAIETTEYILVYDAATAEFPWGTIFHFVIMLATGMIFLVIFVLQKHRKAVIFTIFWIVSVFLLGWVGAGNVVYQHLQCKEWLESKNYNIVEGIVENFHPMPKGGHDTERFTVKNVKFEFSDFNLSKGGFNNTSSHGGPIRERLPVRIAYKNGRILKLEIKSKK